VLPFNTEFLFCRSLFKKFKIKIHRSLVMPLALNERRKLLFRKRERTQLSTLHEPSTEADFIGSRQNVLTATIQLCPSQATIAFNL